MVRVAWKAFCYTLGILVVAALAVQLKDAMGTARIHARETELLYVLSGSGTITVGGVARTYDYYVPPTLGSDPAPPRE